MKKNVIKIALMGLAIGTAIGGCDKPKAMDEQQGNSCSGQSGCKGKSTCKGQQGCTGRSDCTGSSGCKGKNGCTGKSSCVGPSGQYRNSNSSELQQKREGTAKEMNR